MDATLHVQPGTALHRLVVAFLQHAVTHRPEVGWPERAMAWLLPLGLRLFLPLRVDMGSRKGVHAFAVELPWLIRWVVRLVAWRSSRSEDSSWRVVDGILRVGPWVPQRLPGALLCARMDDLSLPEAPENAEPIHQVLVRARRATVDLASMEDRSARLRWSIDLGSEPDAALCDKHLDEVMAKICADMEVQCSSERTRTGARLSGELVLRAPADWSSHLIALIGRLDSPEQAALSGPG